MDNNFNMMTTGEQLPVESEEDELQPPNSQQQQQQQQQRIEEISSETIDNNFMTSLLENANYAVPPSAAPVQGEGGGVHHEEVNNDYAEGAHAPVPMPPPPEPIAYSHSSIPHQELTQNEEEQQQQQGFISSNHTNNNINQNDDANSNKDEIGIGSWSDDDDIEIVENPLSRNNNNTAFAAQQNQHSQQLHQQYSNDNNKNDNDIIMNSSSSSNNNNNDVATINNLQQHQQQQQTRHSYVDMYNNSLSQKQQQQQQQQQSSQQQIITMQYIPIPTGYTPTWSDILPCKRRGNQSQQQHQQQQHHNRRKRFTLSLINMWEFTIDIQDLGIDYGYTMYYNQPESSSSSSSSSLMGHGLRAQIKKIAREHVGQNGRKGAIFERGNGSSGSEGIIPDDPQLKNLTSSEEGGIDQQQHKGKWRIPLGAYHSLMTYLTSSFHGGDQQQQQQQQHIVEGIPPEQLRAATLGRERMDKKSHATVAELLKRGVSSVVCEALAPYQRDGVEFLLDKDGRALLADEMGLGK